METVKVDAKGRVAIPSSVRKRVRMQAGDVYFIQAEEEGGVIRLARAMNPFDRLAVAAIDEYEAGETMSLRDFAAQEGVDPDAE